MQIKHLVFSIQNTVSMKTIGLIGGLSWQSTLEYYRIINETMTERLGNGHAAKIIIDSLDFGEVDDFIHKKDFAGLSALIVNSAKRLEKAGAEILLIGANTMHFVAQDVIDNIQIPLLHIVEATIEKIREKSLTGVALLGTRFTMEQDFYKQRLIDQGIEVFIPSVDDMDFIHNTIFTELFKAVRNPESKKRFLRIIDSLVKQGAQGVILGCTEIPMLIKQEDCTVPVFDTTEIHALAAVELAL